MGRARRNLGDGAEDGDSQDCHKPEDENRLAETAGKEEKGENEVEQELIFERPGDAEEAVAGVGQEENGGDEGGGVDGLILAQSGKVQGEWNEEDAEKPVDGVDSGYAFGEVGAKALGVVEVAAVDPDHEKTTEEEKEIDASEAEIEKGRKA